jgi:tetratricopeptide (TPR) repeat protein
MRFKGLSEPLPEIARALHADAVLEGSVLVVGRNGPQRPGEGQRVRINARLIYAGTDTQLWDRTFEKVVSNVLSLQSEVAKAVADGIHLRLTSQQERLFANAPAPSAGPQQFDSFDMYLRGRYYWNQRTEPGFRQSIQYFQEAINRDPRNALAYAGIADAYYLLGVYDFMPQAEARALATAAASQALTLDDSLAEAYASLGAIHGAQMEWDAAEANFKRALELKSSYATAYHWYSLVLARRGRSSEALAAIDKALELDPLSLSVNGQLAVTLMWARRYDEAIARLDKTLQMDPNFAKAHMVLAEVYAHKGDYARALTEARVAVDRGGGGAELLADVGYIYAVSGRPRDARRIIDDLANRYRKHEDGAAGALAIVYAGLGDRDRAFDWLERARVLLDPAIPDVRHDARFDKLHDDVRFRDFLAKVGLVE